MSVKTIEPRLSYIGTYLNTTDKFVVPPYQREYSWTTENCDKLWQDIDDFLASHSEDPYFFGTIILDCSQDKCLNLIDGQQRTTTFLLLMKALQLQLDKTIDRFVVDKLTKGTLRGLDDSRNTIYRILYKANSDNLDAILENWEYAKNITILENQSINENFKNDFVAIIEAKDFDEAEEKVSKIKGRIKDNKYSNYFKNFKFFYTKIEGLTESELKAFAEALLTKCQIIEIRSWQLEQAINMFNSLNSTGQPLSDSDIISAQMYSCANEGREEFGKKWKNIKNIAEKLSQKKVVDLDGVLQQYMYILRASVNPYKQNNVQVPGVRKYYKEINKELLNDPIDLTEKFEKILNIWDEIKNYPIIKVMMKFNENFKLFLMPYLFKFDVDKLDVQTVTQISEGLLRLFALIEIGEKAYSSAHFKSFLFNLNLEVVKPETNIDYILSTIDSHIQDKWNEEDVEKDIKKYRKNILVFLNDYLYSKEKGKGADFDFADSVNIEHIMPASGKDISTIRIDAGIESEDEFKDLVNQLGNKILLEDDINRSVSNDWFKTKKGTSIKDKQGYKDSKYALAKDLSNYPKDKWEKEDIEKATDKAAKRIIKFIFNKNEM